MREKCSLTNQDELSFATFVQYAMAVCHQSPQARPWRESFPPNNVVPWGHWWSEIVFSKKGKDSKNATIYFFSPPYSSLTYIGAFFGSYGCVGFCDPGTKRRHKMLGCGERLNCWPMPIPDPKNITRIRTTCTFPFSLTPSSATITITMSHQVCFSYEYQKE